MLPFSAAWITGPISAVIVFGQIMSVLRSRATARAVRAQNLGEAVSFLRSHEEALREFEATEAPESLKRLLIFFSGALSTEDEAGIFAGHLLKAAKSGPSPEENPTLADLQWLRENRPGIAQIFDRAITSGLIAAAYRWPSVAQTLKAYVSHLAVDREREVAVVVRATSQSRRSDFSDFGAATA